MALPKHIVIVPDGNRRWAKRRGLRAFLGHEAGAKTSEKILRVALDLKIPYLTFWGASVDNIEKRPAVEVKFLLSVIESYFRKLIKDPTIFEHRVKVRALGRWEELFPERLKKVIREAIEKTAGHSRHHLTFLLAYSGLDEMRATIEGIAAERARKPRRKITDKTVKAHLWTRDLPPVDLVVRTGGAPHWSSGFMMWDVAYAQLYFTETLWPEFSVSEFRTALKAYSQEGRRFGK